MKTSSFCNKVQKLVTTHGLKFKGKVYKEIDMELKGIDNNTQMVTFNIIHPKEIFGNEVKLAFKVLRRGPFMATDTSKINEDDGCWDTHKKVGMKKKGNRMVPNCVPKEEDNPRIPRKKGQPAGSDKHSDLYTDENPEGTIQGLGFKSECLSLPAGCPFFLGILGSSPNICLNFLVCLDGLVLPVASPGAGL